MGVWHSSSDGYVQILGIRIFYRSFGEPGNKGTVLCLHGGPGAAHDYMLPLTDLAQAGYRVVLYDQMGCGRSELPKNKSLLTVERHVEEVEGVRRELKLGKIHLVGSSCGGMFGLAYALKYQANLRSMTQIGGFASTPFYLAEVEKLKSKLPSKVLKGIKKHEANSDYENPAYLNAVTEFYKRHVCRLPEWPPEVKYSMEQTNGTVYKTMWGPNEFTCIGALRYWDVTDKIHQIKIPCLIITAKYDEVTPNVAKSMHAEIKNSKLVLLDKSAHLCMWDEREKFIEVMRDFLGRLPQHS
ncbi:MAG TPA: proline iminopeptidase-family hydrolase [Candidatus Bathyarchaeia archaeon]|nr:proline iminopeptidase-family hydrolase [Candidatus Bathyarchaeia archaeon]